MAPSPTSGTLAAKMVFLGIGADVRADRLARWLADGRHITGWATFEAAHLEAAVITTYAFGQAPGGSAGGGVSKPAGVQLYASVELKLTPKNGLHAEAAQPTPVAALNRAAGPAALVRVVPSPTGTANELSASVVFRGPGCQARAAQLASLFSAPVPAIVQWPQQWLVKQPLFINSRSDPASGAPLNLTNTANASFAVYFRQYTLDTFSATAQSKLLDSFSRLAKSKPRP